MKSLMSVVVAAILLLAVSPATAVVNVVVTDSTTPWLGWMNVFELPANGGAFVFGEPWGLPDLVATFDDVNETITLAPNTIADVNEFWYQNTTGTAPDPVNPGGPGQLGNKVMEANLYQEITNGSPELTALQTDGILQFDGTVISNSFTTAHVAEIFIKEFSPDYGTVTETAIAVAPGAFSLDLPLTGLGGAVQYGFRVIGENVWATDIGPFGNAVISTGSGVAPGLVCDADSDGDCDMMDIDALYAAFGSTGPLDLDGSGAVDAGDIVPWLTAASDPLNGAKLDAAHTYENGDVNLDGSVNSDDLGILLNNFGDTSSLLYGGGNLNGDTNVNSDDLGIQLNNFGHTSLAASAVPEPSSAALVLVALFALFADSRRRR